MHGQQNIKKTNGTFEEAMSLGPMLCNILPNSAVLPPDFST